MIFNAANLKKSNFDSGVLKLKRFCSFDFASLESASPDLIFVLAVLGQSNFEALAVPKFFLFRFIAKSFWAD